MKIYEENIQSYLYFIFLSLILVLSDWLVKSNIYFIKFGLPFSDMIVFVLVVYNLFFLDKKWINNLKEKKIYRFSFLIILINLIFHFIFSKEFELSKSYTVLMKSPVYLLFLAQNTFLFASPENENKKKWLKTLKMITLVLIFIDLYIRVAIKYDLPFKFIWTFTRSDLDSYIYRGSGFVRSKSIFSEPSYYGQYLNLILFLILKNLNINVIEKKERIKLYFFFMLIIMSIFLTFSIAAIFLCLSILIVMLLFFKSDISTKTIVVSISLITIIFFSLFIYNPDAFERMIFRRINQILNEGDLSANSRLIGSWLQSNNLLLGNGFGQTTEIWNNLAYVYSDFGILFMILYLAYFYKLFDSNSTFLIFILFHFTKGGYMSSFNILFILAFVVYFGKEGSNDSKY